jgi:hypothetical protein
MTIASTVFRRSISLPDMTSGVRDLRDRIILLEQEANAALAALYRIRARTSRVLTATSAFEKFGREARSFEEAVRTLTDLSPANRESVDDTYVPRELARLGSELEELRTRYASELAEAPPPTPAPVSIAPRSRARRKRWWQLWMVWK